MVARHRYPAAVMRDRPPGRRALACSLVLALLLSLLPSALLAQDEPMASFEGAFEISGDVASADLRVAWSVMDAGSQWQVEAIGPTEEIVSLVLEDAEGQLLDRSSGYDRAGLFDLDLAPGSYTLVVLRGGEDVFPVSLAAARQAEEHDPEPNDSAELAVPIADGEAIRGRLARIDHDEDRYLLDVIPGDATLRDIELSWDGEKDRELCLIGGESERLQCRRSQSPVALTDLALTPAAYQLLVTGSVDAADPYQLRITPTGPRPGDYEAEPNDDVLTASSFEAERGVRGRSRREDVDVHEVTIEGDPQLWRVELSGPQIDQLAWVRGVNDDVAISRPGCDGQAAVLDDLVLVPGAHRFRVRTCEGEYQLRLFPLGPPDTDGEREPNNDDVRAEAYEIGAQRTGRLTTDEDLDHFRFTLAAPQLIHLRLTQPNDAQIDLRLYTGGTEVFRQYAPEPGADLELDLWLLAGDYLLRLAPRAVSEGTYQLSTERLDPFDVPADAEPNDQPGMARMAPASLAWQGTRAGANEDTDGYWLPELAAPGPIRIRVDDERPSVRLYSDRARGERVPLEQDEDGVFVAAEPPLAVPLYLELHTEDDYAIELEAPGWPMAIAAPERSVQVELELGADEVAAYWPEGQRVDGAIRLTNRGAEDLDLRLETASSHYAWELLPEAGAVSLPAGETVEMAATLEVAPDVWAGSTVQVTLAAVTPDGVRGSASASIEGTRDAEPVGSHLAWPLPAALLGGLNVAGAALGGMPSGSVAIDREPSLYDDLTPTGAGFGYNTELPLEIVVDLAGDTPVPVRGTILNSLARGSRLGEMVRDFELLLSVDGETWQSVLRGELGRMPIDQSFVLDEPLLATQAMLRVHSLHGPGGGRVVSLGEWKVIVEPGFVPDDMPANIAAPIRGGYVARHKPFMNGYDRWYAMLDADLKRQEASFDRAVDEELMIVIGFQEGRAAQVTGLRWHDPDGSDAEERVDEVDVAVSTDGPLGPWQRVGSYVLERAADGSVAPFELDEPSWARYVRLSADLPAGDARQVEFPGQVEVLERVTDDEYRSILGEWGYTSDRGPYELLVSRAAVTQELDPDAGDTPETATLLASDTVRTDRAEILEDVDWYRVGVPAGHNTLTFEVQGVPTVGVNLSLFDASGGARPMDSTAIPGGERYEAVVEPGASYALLVDQPPFNVAFTFDTSGSMGPYLDFIYEGMRVFASDIEPGRELAMIVPFDEPPLLPGWQDQPLLLEDAVNSYIPVIESSNIERGLQASAGLLRGREGVRAILATGDAETGTLDEAPEVWADFDEVQPTVYAVHVGADSKPEETRNLMRAWAQANGGLYTYPTTHAEMERSFERMSTRLRRPSTYALTARTAFVNRDPAALSVVAPVGQPAALAPDIGVEIILDTSGSMRNKLDGKPRISIAKASLRELIDAGLAEGVPVALRSFDSVGKSRAERCQTTLSLALGPLDRAVASKVVSQLRARKPTRTPIAAALLAVADDLAGVTGSRTVVLITDGDETCDGDPEAAIGALQADGIDVTLNIVGFALEDDELRSRMASWAAVGDGNYYDAAGSDDLAAAIGAAVAAPYRVYRLGDDEPVAGGTVGGVPVQLERGAYRVEVLTDPPTEFDEVILAGGESLTLELPVRDE